MRCQKTSLGVWHEYLNFGDRSELKPPCKASDQSTHAFVYGMGTCVSMSGCVGVCGCCRYWTDFLANPQHVADLQAWGINFVRLGFMYVVSTVRRPPTCWRPRGCIVLPRFPCPTRCPLCVIDRCAAQVEWSRAFRGERSPCGLGAADMLTSSSRSCLSVCVRVCVHVRSCVCPSYVRSLSMCVRACPRAAACASYLRLCQSSFSALWTLVWSLRWLCCVHPLFPGPI